MLIPENTSLTDRPCSSTSITKYFRISYGYAVVKPGAVPDPLADPLALGVISGLSLDRSLVGLCALYWRTAVALACGVRQIVDQFEAAGHPVNALTIAGGLTRSDLLTQLFADCCDLPALRPDAPDTVMLGTAMAAAAGSGLYPDLPSAAQAMRRGVTRFEPEAAGRYDRDHAAFRLMQRHRADLRDLATG